jgi:cathepsin L
MLALFASLAASAYLSREERQFVQWMRSANVLYTGDEYHFRLGIFQTNARFVAEHNRAPGAAFRCAINRLAALTPAEYRSLLGYRRPGARTARPRAATSPTASTTATRAS